MSEGPIIIRDGDAGGIPLSGEAAANQRRQLRSLRRQLAEESAALAVAQEKVGRLEGDVERMAKANQRLSTDLSLAQSRAQTLKTDLDDALKAIEELEGELAARKDGED